MKRKYDKVLILAYYNLDGDYLSFAENDLHNKILKNVCVEIKTEVRTLMGIDFAVDVICIDGEEPIECELVSKEVHGKDLTLNICQDWG